MDKLNKQHRSENMSKIRHKNTQPELAVRKLVTGLGYRYRLHAKDLPGRPDLVLRRRRLAIFVHGCFWHMHSECREGRMPGSRVEYWRPKLMGNVKRDREHLQALAEQGWRVLVIWECELNDPKLMDRLQDFFAA